MYELNKDITDQEEQKDNQSNVTSIKRKRKRLSVYNVN